MKHPATIVVPGITALLERFLRPLAATAGDGIEIRQTDRGTTVSACEGRHAATITTRAGGDLEPILVDPAALAVADPSQPLKIYRLAETTGAIVRVDGSLETVSIREGTLPSTARDVASAVEGEIASGMTKEIFQLDPRHLLAVAEAMVATGAETVTIAAAPRWNVLAAIVETGDLSATFLVAGETLERPSIAKTQAIDEQDPLAFTIEDRKRTARASARHRKVSEADWCPDDIPF